MLSPYAKQLLPSHHPTPYNYTMNPADVSDIVQTPEERATHYFQPTRTHRSEEKKESEIFPRIFYMRKAMRELLDERTILCTNSGLSSSRKSGGKIPVNREELAREFSLLFPDCPHKLVDYNWAVVEDRGTVYGFISSEERHVPLCRSCGWTVYVSLRDISGKISCGNSKCKMKLLGEFELTVDDGRSHKSQQSRQTVRDSRVNSTLSKQKQEINDIDKMLITKAAKKAHD